MLHFSEKPQTGLLSLLHCASAVWVNPYKRASRIEIQPIELTLPLSNWSYAAIVYPHLHLHQLIRVAPFQPIRMVLFGPIKLWAFGVICIETDQSGTRMSTSLYKSQSASPLSLDCLLSVSTWRLCFSSRSCNIQNWSCNTGQSYNTRGEQSGLARLEM